MSVGDLSASMGLDIGEFTRSIDMALSRLDSMSASATDSIRKIETSVAPATSAMQSLTASTAPTTAAIKQQQAAVEAHSRTWSEFASGGIKSTRSGLQDVGDAARSTGKALRVAGMASWVASLIPGMGMAGKVAKTLAPIFSTTGKEMRSAGWYAQLLGKDYDSKLSTAQVAAGQSAGALAKSQEQVKESSRSMLSSVSNLSGSLGTTAVLATVLWKGGLDEAAQASWKFIQPNSALMKSLSSMTSSLSDVVTNGLDAFGAGIKASVTAVLQFTTGFGTIEEAVDAGGNTLTEWGKFGAEVMKNFVANAKEAQLQISAFIASSGLQGAGFKSKAFVEEGRKLNELAEQTAKTMAKQNDVKAALTAINDAAGKAASDARTKNELARIATISSVEAIDAEIRALKEATAAKIFDGTATKNWKKEQEAKAAALGQRKEDLTTGKDADKGAKEVAKQIEAAQKKLDELKLGEESVALATAKANGASEEQIVKLQELQEQIKATTAAKDAQKKVDEANKKAVEQVAELRDKYDELTGAATKADIAARKLVNEGVQESTAADIQALMEEIAAVEADNKATEKAEQLRVKFAEQIAGLEDQVGIAGETISKGQAAMNKALREGATEDEAKKIGELTDESEKDKEKDKKPGHGGSSDNQAVLAGTAEAAKLMFGGSSKLEALAEKQIGATKDVAKAIAKIAPPEIPPGKDIDN